MSLAVGLQPRLSVVPPVVITGPVLSDVHLTVREVVAVLRHASVAVNVLILQRAQPYFEHHHRMM